MSNLFVFSGAMGVGKSTAAQYLSLKYGFVRIAFADKLKQKVKLITPDGRIDKARDRKLLQFVATEYYRDTVDVDFWVKAAAVDIQAALDSGKPVVVDDARFENEFEWLKAAGAKFVHILSPEEQVQQQLLERDKALNLGIKEHVSENAIGRLYANELIYNDSTREKYLKSVDIIYQLYRERVHG